MKHFTSVVVSLCLALTLSPPSATGQSLPADGSPMLAPNPLPLPMLTPVVPITTTINNAANQTTSLLQLQQQQALQPNLSSNAYDRPLLLPVLVNSLLLRPLVTLNEQIAQSAAALPSAASPERTSTATGNALLANLNRTLLSLAVNGTLPPVEESNSTVFTVYQSLPSPAQVMGQMNAAFNAASMAALNASSNAVGSGLNSFGSSLATAGAGVQQLGGGVLGWAATMDRMRQQLAQGNYNITFGNGNGNGNGTGNTPAPAATFTLVSAAAVAPAPASPVVVMANNSSSNTGNQSSEVVMMVTPSSTPATPEPITSIPTTSTTSFIPRL
ncbi:hypothetical protein TYRP_005200 [Tyrophagus putrescentiae]|nr:hypothetical protein TYRP_005200 [Tyrophagus putrescentiae]